jgi:hypothetical protein
LIGTGRPYDIVGITIDASSAEATLQQRQNAIAVEQSERPQSETLGNNFSRLVVRVASPARAIIITFWSYLPLLLYIVISVSTNFFLGILCDDETVDGKHNKAIVLPKERPALLIVGLLTELDGQERFWRVIGGSQVAKRA